MRLLLAAEDPNPGVMRSVLASGLDVNTRDKEGRTALMVAAATNDNPRVIEVLLAAGAEVRALDGDDVPVLIFAARFNGNPRMLEALLAAGAAEAIIRDAVGNEVTPAQQLWAALMVAARFNDNPAVVETLLAAGADVNAKGKFGETALMRAVQDNKPAVVEALLAAGAEVNARDALGETALMKAANNPQVLAALRAAGADVNARDKLGRTALMQAVEDDNPAVIAALRAAGADLNVRNEDGETSLMEVVMRTDNPAEVKALLAAGADVNARDKDGETVLMKAYPVTQAQWRTIMGHNPSEFKGWFKGRNPVENVSWNDVQAFIARLNAQEGHDRYRLPTEAEWEYACRAGSETVYSFGDDKALWKKLPYYAWYGYNAGVETHPVGQKKPNAWGLHDMHGNVQEWMQDGYRSYSADAVVDPQETAPGEYRAIRGGSWMRGAEECRSAWRGVMRVDLCFSNLGFRLALSVPD